MSNPQKPHDSLSDAREYYQQADEDSRLRTGWFRLEFARTQELILRHLSRAPAIVIDVGGGSGVYSCWLASLGYEVHLVDAVPKLVDQARNRSAQQERPIASARLGDARQLEFKDHSADFVLLLGPLYHLTEPEDRIKSLREAYRVLRPGGILFGAAISRFASVLDSLSSGFFDRAEFAGILQRDLADGQHRNTTGNLTYFTTAFFHRPAELSTEMQEVGFQITELVAIEGSGWIARDFDRLWQDDRQRTRLLECVRTVEHETDILGVSAHFMAIARK